MSLKLRTVKYLITARINKWQQVATDIYFSTFVKATTQNEILSEFESGVPFRSFEFVILFPFVFQQVAKEGPISVLDPSELHRPEIATEKPVEKFRNYEIDENDPIKERVRITYKNMHTYQTVDFVKSESFYLRTYVFFRFTYFTHHKYYKQT